MIRFICLSLSLMTLSACQGPEATQEQMDELNAAREWQDKVRAEEIQHPRCDFRASGTGSCVMR